MPEYNKNQIDSIKKIFNQEKRTSRKPELNIFSLISAQYHKENLNSDVIAGLLDIKSNPEDSRSLMDVFLDALNSSILEKNQTSTNNENIVSKIDKTNFKDYEVEREENRIDIIIKNKSTSSAIIIENKINNAPDMDNQIPRYYEKLVDEKFEKIWVLYLPLTKYKKPEIDKWTICDKEKKKIENSMVIIPVYSRTGNSLIKDWLEIALQKCNLISFNTTFVLKQYKQILEINAMNEIQLKKVGKFIELLKDKEGFDSFSEAMNAYNKVPEYLARNFEDKRILKDFYKERNSWSTSNRNEWAYKCQHPNFDNIPEVIRISFHKDGLKIQFWANEEGTGDLSKNVEPFLDKWEGHKFKKSENLNEYYYEYDLSDFSKMESFIKIRLASKLNQIGIPLNKKDAL